MLTAREILEAEMERDMQRALQFGRVFDQFLNGLFPGCVNQPRPGDVPAPIPPPSPGREG